MALVFMAMVLLLSEKNKNELIRQMENRHQQCRKAIEPRYRRQILPQRRCSLKTKIGFIVLFISVVLVKAGFCIEELQMPIEGGYTLYVTRAYNTATQTEVVQNRLEHSQIRQNISKVAVAISLFTHEKATSFLN